MFLEKEELEKTIRYYQLKIQGQGIGTNPRDEEVLERLMGIYTQSKGK